MIISIVSCERAVRTDNPRPTVIELHVLELRQITLLCVARALRASLSDSRKFLYLLVTSEAGSQFREKRHDRAKDRETKVFANAVNEQVYHLLTSIGAQVVTFRKPILFLGGALIPNSRSESINPVSN